MRVRGWLFAVVAIGALVLLSLLVRRGGPDQHAGNSALVDAPPQREAAANHRRALERPLRVSPAAVRASPSASFSGRVVNRATGAGIDHAELTFSRDEASHSVMSGVTGTFRFDPPEPGTYQLAAVTALGFQPFAPEWGQSPLALVARPGTAMSDLVIQLDAEKTPLGQIAAPEPSPQATAPGLSISGKIVDAEGSGLPGVPVTAGRAETSPFAEDVDRWTSRSEADGSFVVSGLSPGAYTLSASWPGLVTARAEAVPAGSEAVVLRLVAAGGLIGGRVVADAGGRAVPSFAVIISQPAGKIAERPVQTRSFLDPEGLFLLGPVAAGEYLVRVVAAGYAPSPRRRVTASVGQTADIEVHLSRGGTLLGTVLDANTSAPVAEARISLEGQRLDASLPIPLETVVASGADGRFALGGIPPGLRSVSAGAPGYDTRLLSGIQIAEGETVGPVEIRLTPLSSPDAQPKTELTGIGAQLAADGDVLVIGKVFAGGGAAEGGLRPGDRILAIDGQLIEELDFNAAIQRIRGPEGSAVILTVRRDNGEEQTIVIIRRLVRG